MQIVGVVRDSKYESLREETYSQAFFPASQIPEAADSENFELRAERSPSALIPSVQDAVRQVNKGISLDFHSLAAQLDDSLVQDRLLATLSTFFGGLALLLTMIGLYGAFGYLVTMRRAEFGVRMALGAEPGSVCRLILGEAARLVGAGTVLGIGGSLAAATFLRRLFYGVRPWDAPTLTIVGAVLILAALLASYIPARRAASLNPVEALRSE